MQKRIFITNLILISLLLILGCVVPLAGTVRTVSLNGSQQYTTIWDAVQASVSGDTVLVYPGRYRQYTEIGTNNLSIISLEFYSHNPAYIDSTIIYGDQRSQCFRVNSNTQGTLIRGFSCTNAGLSAIDLFPGSNSKIVNCNVYGNPCTGISVNQCTVFLSGVNIHDNHSSDRGGGVYFNGCADEANIVFNPINRCSIYNNTAGRGQDIFGYELNHNQEIFLDKFTVANPTSYYAAIESHTLNFNFHFNFDILRSDHQEINHDLYVSPNGDDANDGLTPQTAIKTIHIAIYRIASDSLQQKTVYILPGTYSNAVNQQLFPIAMKNWVRLIGSGIGSTIIKRDTYAIGQDNTCWVIQSGEENHYQITGMTLQCLRNPTHYQYSAAIEGLDCNYVTLSNLYLNGFRPGSPVISGKFLNSTFDNITIENISTNCYGLLSVRFQGTMRNCTFRKAVNGFTYFGSTTTSLVNIAVCGNLRMENCLFEDLAMSCEGTAAVSIGNVDNSQCTYDIVNCMFRDLKAQIETVGIYANVNPVINITNCTFAGNTGSSITLGFSGRINITNSIFYNETLNQISIQPLDSGRSSLNIDYSDIRNGLSGIGYGSTSVVNYGQNNLSVNPQYQGGDEHGLYNYYLSENSPCIDAGTPDTTGLTLPGYDLLGHPRVNNNRIDMGCYEWNGVEIEDNQIPSVTANTLSVYPNPFGQVAMIEYLLPKQTDVSLQIYNLKGQLVFNICSGTFAKGSHSFYWNGKDNRGNTCSSGIYFCKLRTGDSTHVRKMMLMK